jgi:RNA polymerase sigma factor (sigma-70 family)
MLPNGKILPQEEVVNLIADYKKTGNLKSRNKVIMSNIKAVYAIAHKYKRYCKNGSITFDDLVSDGVLGLVEAIERFDSSRHVNFTSYSHWWVFKYVNKNISFGTLNLPAHRLALFQKYERLMQESANNNEDLSLDEICAKLGATKKTLLDTISKKDSLHIDFLPINSESMYQTHRALATRDAEEESIFKKITVDKIKAIIVDNLTSREAEVINGRFGLEEDDPKTLEQMAEEMNISHEYVRTLQNKSIEKIKSILMVGMSDGE